MLLEVTDSVDVVLEGTNVGRIVLRRSWVDVARHVVILGHVALNLELFFCGGLILSNLRLKKIDVVDTINFARVFCDSESLAFLGLEIELKVAILVKDVGHLSVFSLFALPVILTDFVLEIVVIGMHVWLVPHLIVDVFPNINLRNSLNKVVRIDSLTGDFLILLVRGIISVATGLILLSSSAWLVGSITAVSSSFIAVTTSNSVGTSPVLTGVRVTSVVGWFFEETLTSAIPFLNRHAIFIELHLGFFVLNLIVFEDDLGVLLLDWAILTPALELGGRCPTIEALRLLGLLTVVNGGGLIGRSTGRRLPALDTLREVLLREIVGASVTDALDWASAGVSVGAGSVSRLAGAGNAGVSRGGGRSNGASLIAGLRVLRSRGGLTTVRTRSLIGGVRRLSGLRSLRLNIGISRGL